MMPETSDVRYKKLYLLDSYFIYCTKKDPKQRNIDVKKVEGKRIDEVRVGRHYRVTKSGDITEVKEHLRKQLVGREIKGKEGIRTLSVLMLDDSLKGKTGEIIVKESLHEDKNNFKDVDYTPKNARKQDVYRTDKNTNETVVSSVKVTKDPLNRKYMGKHKVDKDQIEAFDRAHRSLNADDAIKFLEGLFDVGMVGKKVDSFSLIDGEFELGSGSQKEVRFLDRFLDQKNIKEVKKIDEGSILVEHNDGRGLEIRKSPGNEFEIKEYDANKNLQYRILFAKDIQSLSVVNENLIDTSGPAVSVINNSSRLTNEEMKEMLDGYIEYRSAGANLKDSDKVFIFAMSMSAKNLTDFVDNVDKVIANVQFLGKEIYKLSDEETQTIAEKVQAIHKEARGAIKSLDDELSKHIYSYGRVYAEGIDPISNFDLDKINQLDDFLPYIETMSIFNGLTSNLFTNYILKEEFESKNLGKTYSSKEFTRRVISKILDGDYKGLIEDLEKNFGISLKNDAIFNTIISVMKALHGKGDLDTDMVVEISKTIRKSIASIIATNNGLSEGGTLFEQVFGSLYDFVSKAIGVESGITLTPGLKIIDGFVDIAVFRNFMKETKSMISKEASRNLYKAIFNGHDMGYSGFVSLQLKSSSRGIGYFNVKMESIMETIRNESSYKQIVNSQLRKATSIINEVVDANGNIDINKLRNLPAEKKKGIVNNFMGIVNAHILSKVCHGDQPKYDFIGITGLNRKGHVNIIRDSEGNHEVISSGNSSVSYAEPSMYDDIVDSIGYLYNNETKGKLKDRVIQTLDILRQSCVYNEKLNNSKSQAHIDAIKRRSKLKINILNVNKAFSIVVNKQNVTIFKYKK